jgi:spore coat polysaccharide biosynthesis protein SpsF
MKIDIIVQARMTSSRLPGKVMMPVLGTPLLKYLIERLKRVTCANEIWIACTTNEADQPIVDLAEKLNISVYRGSEHNVLSRYYYTALKAKSDHILRVTSDCPIIDPVQLDFLISSYNSQSEKIDYMTSGLAPRSYPRGMEAEIFSFKVLEQAFRKSNKNFELEHVTPYIYNHPSVFNIAGFSFNKNESHHRWTVDTIEDFELVKIIIENLFPKNLEFNIHDILDFLSKNPRFIDINSHIHQKTLEDL